MFYSLFFVHDSATTEIYTLSLHDALPILVSSSSICKCDNSGTPFQISSPRSAVLVYPLPLEEPVTLTLTLPRERDRKSTRLNSSHVRISYAVFCLKKKNKCINTPLRATSK